MRDPVLSSVAAGATSAWALVFDGTPKCGTNILEVKQLPESPRGEGRVTAVTDHVGGART
jgi:hypothetical protein